MAPCAARALPSVPSVAVISLSEKGHVLGGVTRMLLEKAKCIVIWFCMDKHSPSTISLKYTNEVNRAQIGRCTVKVKQGNLECHFHFCKAFQEGERCLTSVMLAGRQLLSLCLQGPPVLVHF